MTASNEMTLQFLSRSSNESLARTAAASFFLPLAPTVEGLSDIKTAVSEAVTNAIVHGYRDRIGKIQLKAGICENNLIYIKVKDYGCGIEDVKQAMEPLYTSFPEGERSGLGFSVMQSFMDKVTVRSRPGKGTLVTLYKTLSAREKR